MTNWELLAAFGETEEALIEPVLTPGEKKRTGKPLRTALILAAVIALLALLGVAAKETGFLERLFPEKYETIEDYVNHIAVTGENDGLRLTLHEAVTDGYTVLLVYTVERLDGGTLEGWNLDASIRPQTEEGIPLTYISAGPEAQDIEGTDPAKITDVWRAYGWTGGLGRVYFRLFGLKNRETGETWTPGYLEAEAELKACPTRTAKLRGDLSTKELYSDIVLSPFGFRAHVMTNIGAMTAENAETDQSRLNDSWTGSLELVFRDGEVRSVDTSSGAYLRKDSTCVGVSILSVRFPELTDIRQVKALRIDGVEYPLESGGIPRERRSLSDPNAAQLEHVRAWLYGDHEPAHPDLSAEGETGEGETVAMSLDGVWTDGYTTELLLKLELTGLEPGKPVVKDGDYARPVNLGGNFAFRALDAKGSLLALGVRFIDPVDGLFSIVAECPEKAVTLVVTFEDAELTVPLDMKQLGKLPQVTPQEPRRPQANPEQQAMQERARQAMYDSLFDGFTPVEVNYAADNGLYRVSIRQLALTGVLGQGSLRALVECTYLGDGYDLLPDPWSGFSCSVLSEGQVIQVSANGGGSGIDGVYYYSLDFRGDFSAVDALRLTYTPPRGDRISLDLEPTA